MERRFAVYLSENSPHYSCLFLAEHELYGVVEVVGENAEETTRLFASELAGSDTPRETITQLLNKFTTVTSCAFVNVEKPHIWCYTYNGALLLKRNDKEYTISSGTGFIEGTALENDQFFALTDSFLKTTNVSKTVSHPAEEIKDIIEYVKKHEAKAKGACLVLQVKKLAPPLTTVPAVQRKIEKKHMVAITIIIFIIIITVIATKLVFLIGSVINNNHQKQYEAQVAVIKTELKKTEGLFPKYPSKAIKTIPSLEARIAQLKKAFPEKKSQVMNFETKIAEFKTGFGSLETSPATIFFDVKLIDNKARASSLSLNQGVLTLLDPDNKKAYTIVVDTKKQTAVSLVGLSSPRFATSYNDRLFVFDSKKGIYAFDAGKKSNIIPFDPEWGTIRDMEVFNGNLYLLDTTKDEIYKYFPIGENFAEKLSYFRKGSGISLKTAEEIVIDFSLYVRSTQSLITFTAGERQKNIFDSSIPFLSVASFSKDEKTENYYFLDPHKARIIVVDSKGKITKSLFNEKLKNATTIVAPSDNQVLFLSNNIVYGLSF